VTKTGDGPVSITFDDVTTPWYFGLAPAHRRAVDGRLRELAWDPERAPVRFTSPHGRTVYTALAVVDDGDLWAYRLDFVIDELMRQRAGLPAIAVLKARALPFRR
jgi:hypothetical protein